MSPEQLSRQMQQAGVRRLCVISGESDWSLARVAEWRAALPGDWLVVSDAPVDDNLPHCAPAALRTLLGREFTHAVFDARRGFHAEAFAALAGTLRAGSWLLLLAPPWMRWPQQPDEDSLRWADVAHPLPAPHFVRHLQKMMLADPGVALLRQDEPARIAPLPIMPRWQCCAPQQQKAIVQQLLAMTSGVAVLTAPRGRGKSALAGMLAQQIPRALITAPAKASTEVVMRFAADHFHFMAPDAILAQPDVPAADWLIVDEAAAIPAPLLTQLVARFPRVLLTTTVQGYEGTGRGFILKFCAGLAQVRYFTLDEPLRWSRQDPLEAWINQTLLFEDAAPVPVSLPAAPRLMPADAWRDDPAQPEAAYRLLASAHYRTSPLDLRRLMDAPGMTLWLSGEASALQGALWLVEEGGLTPELAQAVWAGRRRPRGNLVAQSLAAHAGFVEAATLRSRRISRIAVAAEQRRQGIGQALVAAAQRRQDVDFLSVSFGYTEALWAFWRACGFTLVRIGTQREASSGCYAAMAIRALTPAGADLQQRAAERLARDWPQLRQQVTESIALPEMPLSFNDEDAWLAAGFAWAQRPLEASLPVLHRLAARISVPPLLKAALQPQADIGHLAQQAGLSGRKALVTQLRLDAAAALSALDAARASQLRQQVE
ncbi:MULTISPECIES: tRNA(Met) cytidine acetyltransferase TmcA [Pantoea]|jgi:tRNA(Met) cytidine acetyltransferase|nr:MULTISPECIES: GNAT family N-acetyltransferase [Pantoea]MBZ6387122.1 GNAT family N-acetyltransferase [Pantoea piersonii]MBZ6400429.1 GNAT family N-acetyltransferase [Pantoea piersonii]MBZ6429099.1 GNAT family N-acetyltransferase [Pantoea piersonii]NYB03869.1 tRNA(Met) cytidine acetyltransferase [Pantoea piersonii]NYB08686.1 tRNA(Met) cytidine acetyltransferase [Pantoea piersonii]